MEFVEPQLAHRGTGFAKTLLDDPAYVAEQKWDGLRIQVHVEDHRVKTVFSRTGNVLDGDGLGWLYGLTLKVKHAVLDGEVCWPDCVSSDVSHRISAGLPVHALLFDVLALGGKWVMPREYTYRRAVVEEIVRTQADPRMLVTLMGRNKRELFERITADGGEGIVMKRADTPYRPGSRCRDWVKLHNPRRAKLYDVAITGVTDKATYSREAFKTGEVTWEYGVWDPTLGKLRTVGQMGRPGPRAEKLRDVGKVAVVEAKFQFPTGALRHAHFKHFRTDKRMDQCLAPGDE